MIAFPKFHPEFKKANNNLFDFLIFFQKLKWEVLAVFRVPGEILESSREVVEVICKIVSLNRSGHLSSITDKYVLGHVLHVPIHIIYSVRSSRPYGIKYIFSE